MQLLSIVGVMALVPAVLSSPVTEFKKIAVRADDRGTQVVAGLGARKQEVVAAGGNTRDLAIAMLETNTMTTDYTYGDGKTGDGTNFGIFKQNWFILRHSASEFLGQTVDDVDNGAILNSDLGKDIQARHEGEEHYGFETWFSGHRNGETGIKNPGTEDINGYIDAIAWIQQQIESDEKYQSDDTRFWVDVQAI
ncbi:hypothetical protein E8E15_004825 [Penicillium rubens]|uniref:Pc12g13760 protein n=2 Tax=Penicillium chrysogenum species complex TaxID=254878 RepID=B6H096_PENRW|nr:uncharacterized protein N7525_001227 [Penicillium rubens]KZN91531.1 hypothetical protein EN45_016710 [Penicillium chrysogenum]CAP81003.1 Pc12g13760 [Penicillium rubens Wisconsin 54-1255]KAF3017293.1 hypothetical protein E8E15_004825 [Penicillium rubens]KAJ5843486.1 hypothetical protein N7525_001227 [Penicillium rubens]KAJ5845929.1 hypothetical protein N7534_009598 [Penicillium rubens]